MIKVTKINGDHIWINPLIIETIVVTPDPLITLTNGHKYIVKESPEEISSRFSEFARSTLSFLQLSPSNS